MVLEYHLMNDSARLVTTIPGDNARGSMQAVAIMEAQAAPRQPEMAISSGTLSMTGDQARPTKEQEQALIEGCRQGDAVCWERLYLSYRRVAGRALYRILGRCDEIEDLVQTVFVRVLKGLPGFEGRSRFSTWVSAIATNVAMEYLRKAKKHRVVLDERTPEELVDDRPAPDREAVRSEEIAHLQRCLQKLTHRKRNVLLMHDFLQIPTHEIAFMMDIPKATVRTRLFHARREMARRMARLGGNAGASR